MNALNPDKNEDVYFIRPQDRKPQDMSREELLTLVELLRGDVKAAEAAYDRDHHRVDEMRREFQAERDHADCKFEDFQHKIGQTVDACITAIGFLSMRLLALRAEVTEE